MPRPDFEWMRNEMLRNGVAARVVSRTVAELDEHFTDLETEARQSGMTATDASAFAASQLGVARTLVE
ncbi:MAG: hypothetical protein RLN69_07890, partial [Woeseiaceae bacterium]